MNVAVFCASANGVGSIYFDDARKLGEEIGSRGWKLVYGGTCVGLMHQVATATMNSGGKAVGVIPECIKSRGVAAEGLDELVVAPDMKERKFLLRTYANAFVALPGGWGTLEEITEVITLKQLGQHNKPVVFLNTAGFYDGLLDFISSIRDKGFVASVYDKLYFVANSVEEVIGYLENYQGGENISKY